MAKNGIDDLRDHLFVQLERLNDEDLSGDALEAELRRADAVAQVAREVTASAKVEVEYAKAIGASSPATKLFVGKLLPNPDQS